jgi:hypothetical protein
VALTAVVWISGVNSVTLSLGVASIGRRHRVTLPGGPREGATLAEAHLCWFEFIIIIIIIFLKKLMV